VRLAGCWAGVLRPKTPISIIEYVNNPKWTPGEDFFGLALAALIFGACKHKTKQRQRWCTDTCLIHMDDRHPEWQPRRAALPISSADSGKRSVAARRSWVAPGLSSGRFVVAAVTIYCVQGRILDIPHQSAG
jgi:hypothetical protein